MAEDPGSVKRSKADISTDAQCPPAVGSVTVLQRLSPDLRALVLSFIASPRSLALVAAVNKSIRRDAMNPALWAKTLLYPDRCEMGVQPEFLRSFNTHKSFIQLLKQPRFREVTHLSMPIKLKLGSTTCRHIAKALPQLTYLNLCNAKNCKAPVLKDLARSMPNLKTLLLGDPGLCRDDELSNGIAAVGASCRSLQRLELMVLDSSGAITDSVLRAMATLPNLHHLKIVKGTRMPYHGLFAPSRPVPPATSERGVLGLVHAANMTALETLTITGVRGATPAAAEAARANCSQLRQLNMHAWL
eukprot:TRINITY_DN189_c0_g1_i1.p1 TRINITY_DN189_c0_g1~~TRINITY_DN189_c0_g1_i1.p1  ORF type:complete len:302 (+),score=56.39 TRINITY_DN189_c0_g1_i1:494-1399(+)